LKDGFTDLTGKFTYAHVSGKGVSDVKQFSILISNKQYGTVIREVKCPAKVVHAPKKMKKKKVAKGKKGKW